MSHALKKIHTLTETLQLGFDSDMSMSGGGGNQQPQHSSRSATSQQQQQQSSLLNATSNDITLPSKRREADIASGRISYKELQSLYEDLLLSLRKVQQEKDDSVQLLKERQSAYEKNEEKSREDMRALEVRLQQLSSDSSTRMDPLRTLHTSIQSTINTIQHKTARVLQDQERDLIRAFRARLADVTIELENERKKNESGSAEWVARCRKLTEELEWLRDLTDKLTAENKSVLKENRRYKRQMKTQESDREFLIKQLVNVKKENARLRFSFDQVSLAQQQGNGAPAAITSGSDPNTPAQGLLQSSSNGVTISSITGRPMSAKSGLFTGSGVRSGWNSSPNTNAGVNGSGNNSGVAAAIAQSMNSSRASTPYARSRPQSAMTLTAAQQQQQQQRGNSRPGTASGYPSSSSQVADNTTSGSDIPQEKEQRYKHLINKLQLQVDSQTRAYRALKTAHTSELANRTELQMFVKKCIDDVRADIAEKGRERVMALQMGATTAAGGRKIPRAASASTSRSTSHNIASAITTSPLSFTSATSTNSSPPIDPRSIPLSSFTSQQRIDVMSWLMSQDQVIFWLYEKMFPSSNHGAIKGNGHQIQQQMMMKGGEGNVADSSVFGGIQPHTKPSQGSLFNSTLAAGQGQQSQQQTHQQQQQQRPSSSPINKQSPHPHARPQTASVVRQQPTASGSRSSQYERPLIDRSLAGYELNNNTEEAVPPTSSLEQVQNRMKQRPQTATVTSSSASRNLSVQQQQQPKHDDLSALIANVFASKSPTAAAAAAGAVSSSSSSTSASQPNKSKRPQSASYTRPNPTAATVVSSAQMKAQVEEELRANRPTATVEDGDDEDEDGEAEDEEVMDQREEMQRRDEEEEEEDDRDMHPHNQTGGEYPLQHAQHDDDLDEEFPRSSDYPDDDGGDLDEDDEDPDQELYQNEEKEQDD